LSQNTLIEYRLTAGLFIIIIGCLIEYSRGADSFIFVINMFILIAKIFNILDLFNNQKVADPSSKYIDNNY